MKKTLQSHNSAETLGASSKNLLIPSPTQLVLYFLVSLLVLTLFNLRRLWDYLNSVILANGGVGSLVSDQSTVLGRFFDSFSHSIILQVVFWVCIGSLIYVLIWFGRNLVINVLNDVVADNYVHPPTYSRFHYWESVIFRKVFFGFTIVVMLFYFFAGWRLIASLSDQAYKLISQFDAQHSLLLLAGITLVTMAFIHSFLLVGQITLNSWRFIYRDL
jgi:hypothetical protein